MFFYSDYIPRQLFLKKDQQTLSDRFNILVLTLPKFVSVNLINFSFNLFFKFCFKATNWLLTEYNQSGKLNLFVEKTVPLLYHRLHDQNATVAVEAIRAFPNIQR